MSKFIDIIKDNIPYDFFSDTEIYNLFSGTRNSKSALIKRAISKQEIIHIRRGLYLLGERYRRETVNKFTLAQRIYGPSYISFESALSYHNLIPEGVITITSASIKRSKIFKTPIGVFSYVCVPSFIFYLCAERVVLNNQIFFIATPWKAIADYVYIHKNEWSGIKPLIQSLRINESSLLNLKKNDLDKIEFFYKNKRIQRFISSIKKELL